MGRQPAYVQLAGEPRQVCAQIQLAVLSVKKLKTAHQGRRNDQNRIGEAKGVADEQSGPVGNGRGQKIEGTERAKHLFNWRGACPHPHATIGVRFLPFIFESPILRMPTIENKRILAVLDDLFFTVKINESAKRAGLPVEFIKSERDVLEKAKAHPALIIIDLNYAGIDSLKLVQDLKAAEDTKRVRLLGYLSHVQGELKQKAQEAGCNMVLARSAFSQNLPQILKRHAA
jgi:PleD family two-component response regulator